MPDPNPPRERRQTDTRGAGIQKREQHARAHLARTVTPPPVDFIEPTVTTSIEDTDTGSSDTATTSSDI